MRIYILIAILVLAFCSAVCRTRDIAEYLKGEALPAQQAPSTPAPKVSAVFQAEVSQLSASGLRLREALEASLEGNARHLVAVFERANPKQPNEAFEFRIIESNATTVKTIFRRSEFFFSFATAGEMARLSATDINGDKIKEVIVQSSSGGNCWSCNPTEIYQVKNQKGVLIAAGPIQRIADLDGDSIAELLVTDTRWEVYNEISHAASPWAMMVYAWRNGRYVYASGGFAAYYKEEITRLRDVINEAKADITTEESSDEMYVGKAIALAITYAHMGEIERGLKELEALMNSNARTAEQTKRRQAIVNDFRNGESARKLREIKNGDPMQLG